MTGWNPFRKLTEEEQRAVIMKFPGEICVVCGEKFIPGSRGMVMRPVSQYRGVDKPFPAYPKYGGGTTLNTTFRHVECKP